MVTLHIHNTQMNYSKINLRTIEYNFYINTIFGKGNVINIIIQLLFSR